MFGMANRLGVTHAVNENGEQSVAVLYEVDGPFVRIWPDWDALWPEPLEFLPPPGF